MTTQTSSIPLSSPPSTTTTAIPATTSSSSSSASSASSPTEAIPAKVSTPLSSSSATKVEDKEDTEELSDPSTHAVLSPSSPDSVAADLSTSVKPAVTKKRSRKRRAIAVPTPWRSAPIQMDEVTRSSRSRRRSVSPSSLPPSAPDVRVTRKRKRAASASPSSSSLKRTRTSERSARRSSRRAAPSPPPLTTSRSAPPTPAPKTPLPTLSQSQSASSSIIVSDSAASKKHHRRGIGDATPSKKGGKKKSRGKRKKANSTPSTPAPTALAVSHRPLSQPVPTSAEPKYAGQKIGGSEWQAYLDKIRCEICTKTDNDEQIILCDGCDAGFHCYCLPTPLTMDNLPEGDWFCSVCIEYMEETGDFGTEAAEAYIKKRQQDKKRKRAAPTSTSAPQSTSSSAPSSTKKKGKKANTKKKKQKQKTVAVSILKEEGAMPEEERQRPTKARKLTQTSVQSPPANTSSLSLLNQVSSHSGRPLPAKSPRKPTPDPVAPEPTLPSYLPAGWTFSHTRPVLKRGEVLDPQDVFQWYTTAQVRKYCSERNISTKGRVLELCRRIAAFCRGEPVPRKVLKGMDPLDYVSVDEDEDDLMDVELPASSTMGERELKQEEEEEQEEEVKMIREEKLEEELEEEVVSGTADPMEVVEERQGVEEDDVSHDEESGVTVPPSPSPSPSSPDVSPPAPPLADEAISSHEEQSSVRLKDELDKAEEERRQRQQEVAIKLLEKEETRQRLLKKRDEILEKKRVLLSRRQELTNGSSDSPPASASASASSSTTTSVVSSGGILLQETPESNLSRSGVVVHPAPGMFPGEFVVKAVINHRENIPLNRTEYFTMWEDGDYTWEPEESFQDDDGIVSMVFLAYREKAAKNGTKPTPPLPALPAPHDRKLNEISAVTAVDTKIKKAKKPFHRPIRTMKTDGSKNVCCHYCRGNRHRTSASVRYGECTTCNNIICSNCSRMFLDCDISSLGDTWRCTVCLKSCCCLNEHCPRDHYHCFTYRRALKRKGVILPRRQIRKKAALERRQCTPPKKDLQDSSDLSNSTSSLSQVSQRLLQLPGASPQLLSSQSLGSPRKPSVRLHIDTSRSPLHSPLITSPVSLDELSQKKYFQEDIRPHTWDTFDQNLWSTFPSSMAPLDSQMLDPLADSSLPPAFDPANVPPFASDGVSGAGVGMGTAAVGDDDGGSFFDSMLNL